VDTNPGATIAGYRIVRRIGQGAHGAVYLAQAPSVDGVDRVDGFVGHVALKLVPLPGESAAAPARLAFQRSADMALRLQHPGIVALYAAGVEDGCAWLAMEAVAGADLSRYTQPKRMLPEALAVRVCARVAHALAYAHKQGVVHRDVKPANVLADWRNDAVKLADFGLARADDGVQTGTGIVPGSPAFMAPEQLAGLAPTPRSDLYALGATLFQLLAARLPHEANSMGELLRSVAERPVPDICQLRPGLPGELGRVVSSLLAKNPAQRPADAEQAARLLDAVANSLWNST
jgi:serine/threonine protein kinase